MEQNFETYEKDLAETGGELLLKDFYNRSTLACDFYSKLGQELDIPNCYVSINSDNQKYILATEQFTSTALKYNFKRFLNVRNDPAEANKCFEGFKKFINTDLQNLPENYDKVKKIINNHDTVLLNSNYPINQILKDLIRVFQTKNLMSEFRSHY